MRPNGGLAALLLALVVPGWSLPDAAAPLQKVLNLLSELSKEIPVAQQADERQLEEFMARSNATRAEVSTSMNEERAQAASLKSAIAKAEARREELEVERQRAAAALLEAQTTFSVAKLENDRQSGSRHDRLQSLHKDAQAVALALDGVLPKARGYQDADSLIQSTRTFERVVDEDRDPRGAATDFAADRDFTLRKAVGKLREALALGATPVAPAQRRLLQSLPGAPGLSFLQLRGKRAIEDPMAPLAATLAQVKRETAKEIKSTEESQQQTQEAFEEVSKALNEQIEAKKKAVQQLELQIHELEEESSKGKVELKLAERTAAAAAASLADIAALQKQRGTALKIRSETRRKEAEALKEAARILSRKSTSGLQVQQEVAPSFLQLDEFTVHLAGAGSRDGTLVHETVSGASAGAQLEAVRRMVEELLRELRQVQAQDTRQGDWCSSELTSTRSRLHNKATGIEDLQTRQTVAASEYESLLADLKRLGRSLRAMRAATAEAKAQRQQEKAKALADQTSYEESRRMVHEAVAVLKKVYSDSTSGKGVVGLLEFSAQNYADLVDETRKAEEDASFQFKRAKETREVQVAEYEADVKYKSHWPWTCDVHASRSDQLALQLKAMKQELGDGQQELAALRKYLKKVEAQCTVKPEDFASRNAKRDEEIKLLKDAQEILKERDG